MRIEEFLRKKARDNYWQLLYRNAKELNISLFKNKEDLSGIQLMFCFYLSLYSQLYENSGMDEYLTEGAIKDDLRTDAYLYMKKIEREKDKKEMIKESIKGKLKKPMDNVSETTFYRKK